MTAPGGRWMVGWALAFALLLGGLVLWLEAPGQERVVFEGSVPLVPGAGEAPSVLLTPTFELDGPTTLAVRLERSPDPGHVGLGVALVSETDHQVRELVLSSLLTPRPEGGLRGDRTAEGLFDRLPTGRYLLRLAPSFEGPLALSGPRGGASDEWPEAAGAHPPRARVVAVAGRRSHSAAFIALGLLVVPPAIAGLRRLRPAAPSSPPEPEPPRASVVGPAPQEEAHRWTSAGT
jgi:hypothetical protein